MLDGRLPAGLKGFAEQEFRSEQLLWAARPDRRIHALLSFGIWIFALPWTAFALFWISIPVAVLYEFYTGNSLGAPKGTPVGLMWLFAIFGIPFVVVGFAMLSEPIRKLRAGLRTVYVISDRRLAILEGGRIVEITSISPGEIVGMSRKEGPDGRGTLILDLGYETDSDGDRVRKTTELGVIDDVRHVEALVAELRGRPR